jgi:lipopolysaccharide export system permease protein
LSTLERYIIRQILGPTVVGLMLLTFLFTIFTGIRLLQSAALGNLAAGEIIALVVAHDLTALEVLLPSAFFGAVMMSLSNWHYSGEAYAAYASGISPDRLRRPLLQLTLLVVVCVMLLTLFVRPYAYQLRYDLNERSTQLESSQMQSAHFYTWDKDFVIQAQTVQSTKPNLLDVFAQTRSNGRDIVLRATSGQINETDEQNQQRIEFYDGYSYELGADSPQDRITAFQQLIYVAQRPPVDAATKRKAKPTLVLAQSDQPKELAEFQWRLCMPLLAGLMALIAVELSRLKPRHTPYIRYAMALFVYIVVFTSANIVTAAVENQTLPLYPGAFLTVLMVAAAFYFIRRHPQLSLSRPL